MILASRISVNDALGAACVMASNVFSNAKVAGEGSFLRGVLDVDDGCEGLVGLVNSEVEERPGRRLEDGWREDEVVVSRSVLPPGKKDS